MGVAQISQSIRQFARALEKPPRWLELILWLLIIAAIAWPRILLSNLLPTYLWSKDAGSYCNAVFHWLDTGIWQSDPRRGPVYSAFIAVVLKQFGDFRALMTVQHWVAGSSVFVAIVILRVMHGARSLLPLVACGFAYAVYAGPIAMEHLVRNETLLFLFATVALSSWFLSLQTGRGAWLLLAGIAAGLLTLTKNVFAPFPAIVVCTAVWSFRAEWKRVATHVSLFAIGFALAMGSGKWEQTLGPEKLPRQPQAGLLLFGRVAQFTVLDSGIEPEMKALIREDILSYRAFVEKNHKLDNNIVLNRTAVPHMRKAVLDRGGTHEELNRLCKRLAIEAIRAHPWEYLRQFLVDFGRLHTSFATRLSGPDAGEVKSAITTLQGGNWPPIMRAAETVKALEPATHKHYFDSYGRVVRLAWLFQVVPVLLTGLLFPVLVWMESGTRRNFWVGSALLWFFTLVLLCTVGKPLNRYLLPVTPVMFWTLASGVIYLWHAILQQITRAERDDSPAPTAS